MIYCVLGEEMILCSKEKYCDHSLTRFLSQDLSLTELACAPQVSPTASYQEIIQVYRAQWGYEEPDSDSHVLDK